MNGPMVIYGNLADDLAHSTLNLCFGYLGSFQFSQFAGRSFTLYIP